ncbi:unnamed protein product [Sphenostylis stenocarpa]|uniref:Uncharacterized protein n=1 Tax=Sphenostylis stenocarpa TaxID=92480 RepID=A0AA86SUI9_9FABA|nr:unnamed protein product [Sphenostylis stenocarpa]
MSNPNEINAVYVFRHLGFVTPRAHSKRRSRPRKDNRYRPHPKQPPDFGVNLFLKKPSTTSKPSEDDLDIEEEHDEEEDGNIGVVWESDELEAISSLFQGRIPQKHWKIASRKASSSSISPQAPTFGAT